MVRRGNNIKKWKNNYNYSIKKNNVFDSVLYSVFKLLKEILFLFCVYFFMNPHDDEQL